MSDEEMILDYPPVAGDITGASEAENVRHMLVRIAFTSELALDDRFRVLCSKWAALSGLQAPTVALARALDAVADELGLGSRSELFGDPREMTQPANLEELIRVVNQRTDEFADKLEAVDREAIGADSVEFVKSLELPWPWLAAQLIRMFLLGLLGFIRGRPAVINYWVEPADPPAPPFEHRFCTRSDETVGQTLIRFVSESQDAFGRLAEPVREIPRGRVPSDLDAELANGIGRYGRWYYRHRIRGESINSIARDALCDRSTVRYGLREAERLLDLTPYAFRSPLGK